MIFEELELPGLFRVRPEPHPDERGFFARTHCESDFTERGLVGRLAQ